MFGLLAKLLSSLKRNNFPKRPSGALLHTMSKLYDFLVGFVTPPPPHSRQVFALVALADRAAREDWLFLDIG